MAKSAENEIAVPVDGLICFIRGRRVVLDVDLARVYGVPTKQLNQAIKRNCEKFLDDFAFELEPQEVATMRSQFVTASKRNIRYRPWVFTEHGAIMAATVLNSQRAVQMSVFVVRAFVRMREILAQNKKLAAKLAELERKLTARMDDHEKAIIAILGEIKKLMEPPPMPKRREIRFHVRDVVQNKPSAGKQPVR